MVEVPTDIVNAAIQTAQRRRESLAEVPIIAIAKAAGISRSTLLRRLGGTRAALDAALVARGLDLGRRPDVRERAITAAAKIMNKYGLEAATLEAVAAQAECSVPSLHAIFGARDDLWTAVFDRYGPLRGLEAIAANLPSSPEERIHAVCRTLIAALEREPQVLPALWADFLSRPDGAASRLVKSKVSRAMQSLTSVLAPPTTSVESREVPVTVMIELLLGPLFFHALFTPRLWGKNPQRTLSNDEFADVLASAFMCALSRRNSSERRKTAPE
jgi:AcrR family transcriptional regulator